MHEGDGFSATNLWKKPISFANWLVRPASSDKWKAPLNIVGMWKEHQLSIEGIQKRPYPVANILTRILTLKHPHKAKWKRLLWSQNGETTESESQTKDIRSPPPSTLALLVGLTKGVPFLPKKGKVSDLRAEPSCKKLCWVLPQGHKNWRVFDRRKAGHSSRAFDRSRIVVSKNPGPTRLVENFKRGGETRLPLEMRLKLMLHGVDSRAFTNKKLFWG